MTAFDDTKLFVESGSWSGYSGISERFTLWLTVEEYLEITGCRAERDFEPSKAHVQYETAPEAGQSSCSTTQHDLLSCRRSS